MLRRILFPAFLLFLCFFSSTLAAPTPVDHQLKKFFPLELDPATFLANCRSGSTTLVIDVLEVELELVEYSLCPGGTPIFHNDGEIPMEIPTTLPPTFRGSVRGYEGSHLHLTVSRDLSWVRGYLAFDDRWYFIQPRTEETPTSGSAELIVYEAGDVLENDIDFGPDAEDRFFDTEKEDVGGGMNRGNLFLYPVVDTQFININQSTFLDRLWAQIGNVASLYFNRNIVALVVEDYGTFTGSSETNSTLLLGEIQGAYNRNHDRRQHIVHLFTGRVLDESSGGVGFEVVLGRSRGYSLSRTITGFSDYSQMVLTCHELGHNFGGIHGQAAQGYHWNILCGFVGYTIMSPIFIQGCMLDYFSGPNTSDMLGHLGILTWAYPGSANFQINNGATYTNDPHVLCTAYNSHFYLDQHHYGAFALSNGPASNLTVGPFFSDSLGEGHDLVSGDGEKEVFLYAYDANEYNLSTSATIILDTTVPTAVVSLSSPSHNVGEPSNTYIVDMNWGAAIDLTAGIAGYSVLWSMDELIEPDEVVELGNGVLSTTSPILGIGEWYFSIRAVDNSGLVGPALKFGPINLVSPSAVPDDGQRLPTRVSLLNNYPDPFNPKTTINFNLPLEGHVNLAVYNMRGQLIEQLVDETRGAGRHEVTWDGHQYPSGVYFYRMKTGGFNETRKMIMLK